MTNQNSFDNLEDWFDTVKKLCEKEGSRLPHIALVANKGKSNIIKVYNDRIYFICLIKFSCCSHMKIKKISFSYQFEAYKNMKFHFRWDIPYKMSDWGI